MKEPYYIVIFNKEGALPMLMDNPNMDGPAIFDSPEEAAAAVKNPGGWLVTIVGLLD